MSDRNIHWFQGLSGKRLGLIDSLSRFKKKRLKQEIKSVFEGELLSFTKKDIVSVRGDKAGLVVRKQSVAMSFCIGSRAGWPSGWHSSGGSA